MRWISTRTSSSTRRIGFETQSSSRHSDSKYARDGRNEESSRTTSRRILIAKIQEKTMRRYKSSLHKCRILQGHMNSQNDSGEISRSGIKAHCEVFLRFQSTSKACAMTNACLLAHGMRLDLRKTLIVHQLSTLDSLRNHYQGIHHSTTPSATGSVTGRLVARDEEQIKGTNSNSDICKKAVDHEFLKTGGYSADFYGGQKRQQMSELQFDKFPTHSTFLCWKIRFKNQVTTCSDCPSEAILWIKEVEMVDLFDEFKVPVINCWEEFSKFWCARTASAFEQDHPKFSLKEGQPRFTLLLLFMMTISSRRKWLQIWRGAELFLFSKN